MMLEKIAVGQLPYFRLGDVLFFDKIYILSLNTKIDLLKKTHPIYALTLERLRSEEILEEIPNEECYKRIQEKYPMEPSIGSDRDAGYVASYLIDFMVDKKVRLWELAVQIRGDFGVLLVDEYALTNPISKTSQNVEVLDFSIRGLPHPHWNTPIDQLIELRSDPTAREKLFSIHDWVKTVAMIGILDKWLVEELVYRLHAYKECLSSFDVTYGEERLFCCASKDLLKDKTQLQIPEPYDQLFRAAPRVISLMEPEIGDPGTELAIVR